MDVFFNTKFFMMIICYGYVRVKVGEQEKYEDNIEEKGGRRHKIFPCKFNVKVLVMKAVISRNAVNIKCFYAFFNDSAYGIR